MDLKAGVLCALGMLIGAYAGSFIALPMPLRNLRGLFGCFLILVSLLLWKQTRFKSSATPAEEDPPMVDGMARSLGILAIACLCGVASGMFGIGGGVLLVSVGGRAAEAAGTGGSPSCIAVRLQPASRAGNKLDCPDSAHRHPGALGICEGGIRLLESRVAADPGPVFRRIRGRKGRHVDQATENEASIRSDAICVRRVAGIWSMAAVRSD